MRQAVALVAGATLAALAALIVGEYDLSFVSGVFAGALTGLAVLEVARAVDPGAVARWWAVLAAMSGASAIWAGWITVHHRHESIPAWAWAGAVAGAVVVVVRSRGEGARNGGSGNPIGP